MTKRGKVLRDSLAGPGLLIAEGRQYRFVLDRCWKSDVPPKPGLAVDIEFDAQGKIAGIIPVADSQLAKELAELAPVANKKGTSQLAPGLAGFGLLQLIAAVLLIFSWFFLTAVSVEVPPTGISDFTFWQLLRYLSSGNLLQASQGHVSSGAVCDAVLAIIVLAGPFVHPFWSGRRAALGGLLPLCSMLLVAVLLGSNIDNFLPNGVSHIYGQAPRFAREELMSAISLGFGAYVSIAISFYFAILSAKQLRTSKRGGNRQIEHSQRAAA